MSQTPANTTKTIPNLAVSKFRLQNFKAIRDSGDIEFTPLTVFVGGNGVGKSSLVEGLETLQVLARDGFDKAFQNWRGFEFIRNKFAQSPMKFGIEGRLPTGFVTQPYTHPCYSATVEISADYGSQPSTNSIQEEFLRFTERGKDAQYIGFTPDNLELTFYQSVLRHEPFFRFWQFIRLNPEAMAHPKLLSHAGGYLPLATDGSNIAEYLIDIQQKTLSHNIIQGIVETVQYVLPYVNDLQPILTTETGRFAHLQLNEWDAAIPSWLFSSGTLRLVALLALFRHPKPPPLIVIEEIENGLDPSTIAMIVEEIREVVRTGKSQIILTTHSPYLMNLLPLESLMLVERVDGEPRFFRPANDESLARWSEDFAPGDLYAMGRLRRNP